MKVSSFFLVALSALSLTSAAFATSACLLAPKPGFGLPTKIGWYYNHTTEECDSFKTSGRLGGVIPFATKADCAQAKCPQSKCLKQQTYPRGRWCRYPQWYYNKDTEMCQRARRGACAPFRSLEQCIKEQCNPACTLEPKTGPCRAYFRKYFFNHVTGKCEQFVWGGCAGTVPFDTLAECEKAQCIALPPTPSPSMSVTPSPTPSASPSPLPSPLPRRCLLRPKSGICLALFTRWYWDNKYKQCKPFTWGGCGGVVPFKSRKECENAGCDPKQTDKCDVKKEDVLPKPSPGSFTCQAIWTSWYFDESTMKCTSFSYTGCSPVGPFNSEKECKDAECGGAVDKCKLTQSDVLPTPSPGSGTCLAFWTSWYYNPRTGECTSFSYSGCSSVGPFDSAEVCESTCST